MSELGKFIVWEGPDGSGKTNQVVLTSKWLEGEYKIKNVPTAEHWKDDVLGQAIHTVVELKQAKLDSLALQQTFMANRVNHTAMFIKPFLDSGIWVLGDRYNESTINYAPNEYRDMLIRHTKDYEEIGKILIPDLSILVDVPAEEVIRRGEARRDGLRPKNLPPELLLQSTEASKMGRESIFEKLEEQRRVRNNYLERFSCSDNRKVIVDGVGSFEEVQQRIRNEILRRGMVK